MLATAYTVACEQALRGALAAGWEKEGELAKCKMLIGGDDLSNDVITLGTFFFNVWLHARSFPLRVDWRKSDSSIDREQQGNWSRNSYSRDIVARFPFFFSHPTARAPGRACLQATYSVDDSG